MKVHRIAPTTHNLAFRFISTTPGHSFFGRTSAARSKRRSCYLLIGSTKALLIDTGHVADPSQAPLARTVMNLLPGEGTAKLPLLVVHTHRHLDHRAGDGQFAHLASVQMVGFDIDSVRRYYNFAGWPNGVAQVDLGERIIDAIPTPGHSETEVSFYDRDTGIFLAGDFLIPGRLLIDNTSADVASAERVAAFVRDRPISFVLGGHIELNSTGDTFPWGSQYHPHEHVLQMTKDDLLALPAAIRSFNGFYTVRGRFIMMNSIRILIAQAILAGAVLAAGVWMLVRYIRRRKRARRLRSENQRDDIGTSGPRHLKLYMHRGAQPLSAAEKMKQ
jgi:hydroxyacylglutathione hydrolase